MTNRAKKNLMSLSKEQLVQIIKDFDHTNKLISETCISVDKVEIYPKDAIEKIRDYLWETTIYDFNSKNLSLQVNLQLKKITPEQYRKKVLEE